MGHFVHDARPCSEYVPLEHMLQLCEADLDENVEAGHKMHIVDEVAPATFENVPGLHDVQTCEASESVNVPI